MFNKLLRYVLLTVTVLFTFLWQACDEEDEGRDASRLRVKLTDATRLGIKEFHVDITEISILLVDTITHDSEWVKLKFSGKIIDVLKLTNGKTVQMVDQYVPSGRVLQRIKLVFGDNNKLIVNTLEEIPLQLAPQALEGVEVETVPMNLYTNTISSMVIDLNAAFSVVEKDGVRFLNPMVRAFPEVYGGKLRGYVSPLVETTPIVSIVQGTDTLFSNPEREKLGDNKGMFQFIGLKPGEWEVFIFADPDSGYRDSTFVATVEGGSTMDVKTIQLALPIKE